MKAQRFYNGVYKRYEEELIRLRRHFHKYPELALEEYETSGFIRKYLEELGYETKTVAPTGLMAELPALRNRKKLVVLRAEMDALPISEKTGLPYASCKEGRMHACGHDAILASALTVARIVSEKPETFPVGVRFVFEPAEEIGEGAKRMIDAGALRDADAFVMFHYAVDMPFGMAVHEGQASSMVGSMEIQVSGKSAHWCEADKGVDAILGASRVIEAVNSLNRSYQGKGPCLVGLGTVHGGQYANIIADKVDMKGNIRACFEEDYLELKSGLEKMRLRVEQETGTKVTLSFPRPPVLSFANDDRLTKLAAETGKKIFGERFFLEGEEELFLSGDNAYRYFQKVPGVFLIFLAATEQPHPLHHSEFQLAEEILPYSAEALCEIIKGI